MTTRTERTHRHFFIDLMRKLEWDLHQPIIDAGRIPGEWERIAQARGTSPKVKICLRVEQDVVKFFRGMGQGYQQRMNDVLRSFKHARLSGLVAGPDAAETRAYLATEDAPRGHVGDAALMLRGYVRQPDGMLKDQDAVSALLDAGRYEGAGSVRELLETKRDTEAREAKKYARKAAHFAQMSEQALACVAEVEQELRELGDDG